jgi:hypothetical protein
MRLLLRAGLALGLVTAACKDSVAPGDFTDPVAVTADLGAVDSAFDNDAYRSFTATSSQLTPAATAAMRPAASLLDGTRPSLQRTPYTASALRMQQLQRLVPEMSVAAAQGRLIPDSLYGRVYQWDAALDQYTWQGSTVSGLTGVRFILYRVDVDGFVIEPVVEVGYVDLIDQSTPSVLQLNVLVKGVGGTPTYVDYTATVQATATSVTANVTGSITNGLGGGANKTLTFDETFGANSDTGRVTVNASFALNNPAITLTLNESATVSGSTLVVTFDFRVIRPGETVRLSGRITINFNDNSVTVTASVQANGRTVATITGDSATAQWVDAGGEPLTADDLEALDGVQNAFLAFQAALESLFSPVDNLLAS